MSRFPQAHRAKSESEVLRERTREAQLSEAARTDSSFPETPQRISVVDPESNNLSNRERREQGQDDDEWKEWNEWKAFRAWKETRSRREHAEGSVALKRAVQVSRSRSSRSSEDGNGATLPSGYDGGNAEASFKANNHEDPLAGMYGLVNAGRPSGWAAMAQVVRDFDVEKVDDVKDDIDTLLVFAGLFSAVLSAFLIAVYPNLQPSSSDQTLQVLERIAIQTASYTLHPTSLNSTTLLPTAPSTFTPASEDILISALWFASLVLSLVTASFGMLVKQWLREYLAVENPSPQARLRVRHLRYPELRKWKVFDIAAALPLLLQIALGLFFAGLCVLTMSLNPTVNKSTLPLVLGWLFCFVAVTAMPVLYPRCPFKTTFLKAPLQLMRRAIILGIYVLYIVAILPTVVVLFIPHVNADFLIPTSVGHIVQRAIDGRDEEVEAVANEEADVDILAAVDAIQSNDELLTSTIAETLEQVQPAFGKALIFTIEVLQNRLQAGLLIGTPPTVLDLRTMNKRPKEFVVQMLSQRFLLSEHLQPGKPPLDGPAPVMLPLDQSSEILWMLALLFSPSRVPLPPSGITILRDVFLPNAPRFSYVLTTSCYIRQADDEYVESPGDGRVSLLILGLIDALDVMVVDFDTSWQSFRAVLEAIAHHVRRMTPTFLLGERFSCNKLHLWLQPVSRECQDGIRTALFRLLRFAFQQTDITTSPSTSLKEAVVATARAYSLYADKQGEQAQNYVSIFRSLLTQRDLTDLFLETFLWPKDGKRYVGLSASREMEMLYKGCDSVNPGPLGNIPINLADAIEHELIVRPHLMHQYFHTMEVLDRCTILTEMVHYPQALRFRGHWMKIFDAITETLVSSSSGPADDQTISSTAWSCIDMIATKETISGRNLLRTYAAWNDWYAPEKSVFSDELITTLDNLSTHNWHEYPTWRARRRREH